IRVDDFLADKTDHVDVIKMDVEGAEALAVSGMKEILTTNRNVTVFLEYFPLLLEKMGSSTETYAKSLLSDFGFTVFAIGHDYDMDHFSDELVKIRDYDHLH